MNEYDSDVDLGTLAKELGAPKTELEHKLHGDKGFKEVLSSTPKGAEAVKAGKLPTDLTRTAVESQVAVGRDRTESLFCALQQRLTARANSRREDSSVVRDNNAPPVLRKKGKENDAHL